MEEPKVTKEGGCPGGVVSQKKITLFLKDIEEGYVMEPRAVNKITGSKLEPEGGSTC